MKSATLGCHAHCRLESARRCKYTIAVFREQYSSSDLRYGTAAPALTSYLLTDLLCNGWLSPRRIKSLRCDLTRTAPFRVGLPAFFLRLSCLKSGFAESACITVSISLYKETHLEIVSPDEKGQPFSTVSVLSLSYPNGGHFASCFLCAACICLQKRNGPWAVPFFGYSLSRMNSTLRSGAYASLSTNSFSAQPVRSNPFGTVQ